MNTKRFLWFSSSVVFTLNLVMTLADGGGKTCRFETCESHHVVRVSWHLYNVVMLVTGFKLPCFRGLVFWWLVSSHSGGQSVRICGVMYTYYTCWYRNCRGQQFESRETSLCKNHCRTISRADAGPIPAKDYNSKQHRGQGGEKAWPLLSPRIGDFCTMCTWYALFR